MANLANIRAWRTLAKALHEQAHGYLAAFCYHFHSAIAAIFHPPGEVEASC